MGKKILQTLQTAQVFDFQSKLGKHLPGTAFGGTATQTQQKYSLPYVSGTTSTDVH